MIGQRRFFYLVSGGLLLATAACTLILDRSSDQCSTDADCAHFAAGAVCRNATCISSSVLVDGGNGGADGCAPLPATATNDDFMNACTSAQCLPFDNCAILGVCDGGFLGPDPPEGGAGATPPGPDSGATALCTDLAAAAGTSIIYVTGSSNFPPFLKTFAPVLAANDPPYSVVWATTNSCSGVDAIYNAFSGAAAPVLDPSKTVLAEKAGRETDFYNKDGSTTPCIIETAVPVDVGESDIYAKTCQATLKYDPGNATAQANVGEYLGPIMAMTFIVPEVSTQDAISAEAAQAVFGRGRAPDTTKLPYDDPNQLFNRASSTATNQIISRGISIDPTKWWGVDKRSAANMATQMEQVPPALEQKTIGIISTDFADSERGNLKTLAFQAHGQNCAYWPDSTKTAEDKKSVRDGHYPLWGPIHFFTKLTAGAPSAAAGAFVLRFAVPRLDEALVKGITDSHNIPACAMSVTRDEEMGPIKAFEPPFSCACFFEKTATGETTCQACPNGPADCPTTRPACNYGFCEVR